MDQERGFEGWPDKDLVVAYKGGVPEAYDEMYRRYNGRIHSVCRRMLGNTEDAREAAQETFLKAYQALPRFNGQYQLGAWLSRIATNVCLDHIRRRSRSAVMTELTDQHEGAHTDLGPEDVVVHDAPALRALDDMQPLHARALKLRNLQGFSHKEIASQLNMSPIQVKALLHRARTSFKRAWDNASGWALAPLAGLRSLLHQTSKDATSLSVNAPAFASTSPMLAEKVAASAMIVVVALSGGARSGIDTPHEAPRPAAVDAPRGAAEVATVTDAPPPATTAAPKEAAGDAVVDKVTDLLDEVEATTERKADKKKADEDKGDPDDDVGPGSADQASREIVRRVNNEAEELRDSLP